MKKTALLLLLLALTALSAMSQTVWLPVEIKQVLNCGYTVDSSAIYSIAENKRKLEAIYANYLVYQDINASLHAQNTILAIEIEAAEQEVQDLTAKLNDSEAKVKKLKGKRIWWGVAGVAVGAITYGLLTQ